MSQPGFEPETVIAEKIKFAAQTAVTGQMAADLKVETLAGFLHDELMFRLQTTVVAEIPTVVKTEVTFYRPANWWQHFKQAKFPKWAERRWPVRYMACQRTVTFEGRWLFPDAPQLPFPGRLGAFTKASVGPESVRPAGNNSKLS